MKNFTVIPNELLGPSQLSIPGRYLYCVLKKYCGQDEWCYPSQKTLASDLRCSERYVRTLLVKLQIEGLIYKKRRGFNRSNTYRVAKSFVLDRNSSSFHLGSTFPLHEGNPVPPKSTYLKGKGKRSIKGMERLMQKVRELGIKK